MQQTQKKSLRGLDRYRIAKEQYKMLHPELEKERKHILEKAQADALAESVKIKDQAEAMAKEMMKKAHEDAVATTHKAVLVAQSERKEAAEALEKAKEVRELTVAERRKQQSDLTKAFQISIQREKIAEKYHAQAQQTLADATEEAKKMALRQTQSVQSEEARKQILQEQATKENANRLKLSYMPTLTNYERELEASAEKSKRDVETRPMKAIKSAATIQAEAIVGLQAADEALFTARRKAEAAINAEQGASKRVKALEELMASVQLKLGKAEQLPHGKQDDHVEVTKNFAIKEDLEARREDLAMRLEMSKFDYDVRRVQLKKAKACVSLAKRMVDEMSTSSKLIHTKTEDQLHRIRKVLKQVMHQCA